MNFWFNELNFWFNWSEIPRQTSTHIRLQRLKCVFIYGKTIEALRLGLGFCPCCTLWFLTDVPICITVTTFQTLLCHVQPIFLLKCISIQLGHKGHTFFEWLFDNKFKRGGLRKEIFVILPSRPMWIYLWFAYSFSSFWST